MTLVRGTLLLVSLLRILFLPFVLFMTLKDKVTPVCRLALVRARTLINQGLLVALGGVPTSQIDAARSLEDHAKAILIAVVFGVVMRISIADLYWTKKNLMIVSHLVLHHALGQGGIVALSSVMRYMWRRTAASGLEDHAKEIVIAVWR